MSTSSGTPLLSKEQAAGMLGISVASLNRYVTQGKINPVHVGKFVRFTKDSIDLFISQSNLYLTSKSTANE